MNNTLQDNKEIENNKLLLLIIDVLKLTDYPQQILHKGNKKIIHIYRNTYKDSKSRQKYNISNSTLQKYIYHTFGLQISIDKIKKIRKHAKKNYILKSRQINTEIEY